MFIAATAPCTAPCTAAIDMAPFMLSEPAIPLSEGVNVNGTVDITPVNSPLPTRRGLKKQRKPVLGSLVKGEQAAAAAVAAHQKVHCEEVLAPVTPLVRNPFDRASKQAMCREYLESMDAEDESSLACSGSSSDFCMTDDNCFVSLRSAHYPNLRSSFRSSASSSDGNASFARRSVRFNFSVDSIESLVSDGDDDDEVPCAPVGGRVGDSWAHALSLVAHE